MEQTCISYDLCNFTDGDVAPLAGGTPQQQEVKIESPGNQQLLKTLCPNSFLPKTVTDLSCFEAFNQFELYHFQQRMGVDELNGCTEQNNVVMHRRELFCHYIQVRAVCDFKIKL